MELALFSDSTEGGAIMGNSSTLDPDNFPHGRARKTGKGHDVRSLGPSDSSDSGSDMAGPGLLDDDVLGLDRGTNQDSERGKRNAIDTGPSVGDVGADENSDRYGTGERMGAGKEQHVRPGADIDVHRVVDSGEAGLGTGLDEAEEAERR
jgi:hypothetical protein